ncbi:hypothetical protein TVAG_334460 [Trichomonas vaginalis G3]|uniref:Uncharacterized protein n=1 Tax=Trichomonas vaginalis (strain ATCC PRA-98 / G3) TaxID=412133 RepID=A2FQS2_TRIV3|nr:protein ubiquitination [Trichomonas vaginalis G3]EAX92743.1 hypothetical protein TVAG_334460 [Trichomonas vaginalis G3]KAI5515568.1 protein ubiquitination [Trichomonas vaginalis G3]|eukprot:XP_001305673.1 hypothetical protein [Trichomonas vaginalis G3]
MRLDKNNCFEFLEYYSGIESNEKILEICDFISSHFFEIDENKLKSISPYIGYDNIERIIKSKKLFLKDEDSLANFIVSLSRKSETFYPLIEHVHLEFCSEEIINKLVDISDENSSINIIKSLRDSLIRSRYVCHNYNRYNIPKDFRSNVSKYKNSNDFHDAYEILEEFNHIMILIANKEFISEYKFTFLNKILLKASKYGNLTIVKSLIENGCDKEAQDKYGYTPLIWASENDHLDIVQYLISIGADKEARKDDGTTALMCASYKDHRQIVRYLISVGADIEARNIDGWTPLLLAALADHFEVVEYLISVGADMEAKNKYGETIHNVSSDQMKDYLLSIKN